MPNDAIKIVWIGSLLRLAGTSRGRSGPGRREETAILARIPDSLRFTEDGGKMRSLKYEGSIKYYLEELNSRVKMTG